jgi:hypothetical protein
MHSLAEAHFGALASLKKRSDCRPAQTLGHVIIAERDEKCQQYYDSEAFSSWTNANPPNIASAWASCPLAVYTVSQL